MTLRWLSLEGTTEVGIALSFGRWRCEVGYNTAAAVDGGAVLVSAGVQGSVASRKMTSLIVAGVDDEAAALTVSDSKGADFASAAKAGLVPSREIMSLPPCASASAALCKSPRPQSSFVG